jgi:hypothetical protein
MYKNSCYTFQRTQVFGKYIVYETLHICFTLKGKNFSCSIATSLNPIQSNSYNSGLITLHKDLITIKKKKNALTIDEAYYFHNGQIDTTTKAVTQIIRDYENYGIPFLNQQLVRLNENEIIKVGLEYIDSLNTDKNLLKDEIENQLTKGGYLLSSIKHPLYEDLKERLLAITGQSREDRQLIRKTAFELLELYWTN